MFGLQQTYFLPKEKEEERESNKIEDEQW